MITFRSCIKHAFLFALNANCSNPWLWLNAFHCFGTMITMVTMVDGNFDKSTMVTMVHFCKGWQYITPKSQFFCLDERLARKQLHKNNAWFSTESNSWVLFWRINPRSVLSGRGTSWVHALYDFKYLTQTNINKRSLHNQRYHTM